jgi:hypothetical protein
MDYISNSTIGTCVDENAVVTHSINNNQIVVNSPGWTTPAWGFIGSTLIPANKVEASPANPDTPALDLFPGLVCSFADRTVWAYRNQIIISNPGTEPRTLTAPNSLSFNGEITDIFQSAEGDLIVCTTANINRISSDGLAGAYFQGSVTTSPNYRSFNARNAATNKGKSHGLSKDGIIDLTTFQSAPLIKYKRPRRITTVPLIGYSNDGRQGKIYPFLDGYLVSFNSSPERVGEQGNVVGEGTPYLYIDLTTGTTSWFVDKGAAGPIKSIFLSEEGHPILLIGNTFHMFYGERSSTGTTHFSCGIAVDQQVPGFLSHVVREVIPTLNRKGEGTVSSYVRNSLQSGVSIPVTSAYPTVNTSTWDSSSTLETEPRSVRMQRAVRTDTLAVEVGFGPGQVLSQLQVITRGQAPTRK